MNPSIPTKPCWLCGTQTDRYQYVQGNACCTKHRSYVFRADQSAEYKREVDYLLKQALKRGIDWEQRIKELNEILGVEE